MPEANIPSPELAAVDVHGMSRGAFLTRSALSVGALYGAAAVGPFVSRAVAQDGGMEPVDVLNFALTLEYLEATFYERALQDAGLSGEVKRYAQEFGDHESQHVDTLTTTIKDLGGTPTQAPKVEFPLKDEDGFLKLAQTLEDTGVYAYNGAAPALMQNDELLAAAGSIVQVEGRHAAVIRNLAGKDPSPGAFDKTLEMDAVLKKVQPFIQS